MSPCGASVELLLGEIEYIPISFVDAANAIECLDAVIGPLSLRRVAAAGALSGPWLPDHVEAQYCFDTPRFERQAGIRTENRLAWQRAAK